jgi:Hint domain
MTVTYAGSLSTVLTLQPANPDVVLAGTIDAVGSVAQYIISYHHQPTRETIDAAVYAPAGFAFDIDNAGLVTMSPHGAFNVGIVLRAPGIVTNTGTIEGGSGLAMLGAPVPGQSTTVINDGLVGGAIYDGLLLVQGGIVSNTGTIAGEQEGIAMAGLAGSVSNASTATITASLGDAIRLAAGGTVENAGLIQGGSTGITVAAGGTVGNLGSIAATGTAATGIAITGGGYVLDAGSVTAATGISLYAASIGGGALINSGTAAGTTGVGVYLRGGDVLDNTGAIDGAQSGLKVYPGTASGLVFSATNEAGGVIDGVVRYGALIDEAGSLSNAGWITGVAAGVVLRAKGAALINTGTIRATGTAVTGGGTTIDPAGVVIGTTGVSLYNAAGGEISGLIGVTGASAGTIINDGLIVGTGTGGTAVAIGPAAMLINAGTIAALEGASTAIRFQAGTANHLVMQPGAVVIGTVDGGITAGSGFSTILELATDSTTGTTTGAVAGTLGGLGSQFVDFSEVLVDTGAIWSLAGDNLLPAATTVVNDGEITLERGSALTIGGSLRADFGTQGLVAVDDASLDLGGGVGFGETILLAAGEETVTLGAPALFLGTVAGFGGTDAIDLPTVPFTPGALPLLTGADVIVADGATSLTLALGFAGARPATITAIADANGMTELTAACFVAGTRILTTRGEIPVEALGTGDRAITLDGVARPILWTGSRRVNCRTHPRPEAVSPVRIRADAFGPGLPWRDLLLSPDHAVFADGVLVPAQHLVNGATIVRQAAGMVRYCHIELDIHDIVRANGLPAETYLDCGNRQMFDAGGAATVADFAPPTWNAAKARAPLVTGGAELAAIRRRLHAAALALGHVVDPMPRIRLTTGTRSLPLLCDRYDIIQAALPAKTRHLDIHAPAAAPADTDPDSEDRRVLGIALTAISIEAGGETVRIEAADKRLDRGFFATESAAAEAWRWTGAEAALDQVLPVCAAPGIITLHLAARQTRWVARLPL